MVRLASGSSRPSGTNVSVIPPIMSSLPLLGIIVSCVHLQTRLL
jgi:hypothetical protein